MNLYLCAFASASASVFQCDCNVQGCARPHVHLPLVDLKKYMALFFFFFKVGPMSKKALGLVKCGMLAVSKIY